VENYVTHSPTLGASVSQKPPAADVERFLCMLRVDSKGGDLDLQSYRHSYPSLHRHRRQHQASTAISQRDAISTGTASRDFETIHSAQNGYVFQNDGDSLAVAFHSALEALNAAFNAQRLFQNQAWTPAPIKVRIGIHTGALISTPSTSRHLTETDQSIRASPLHRSGQVSAPAWSCP
jgi:hypothetical protein